MIINFKDLELPDKARPLYVELVEIPSALLHQQFQYELRLSNNQIYRFEFYERLANRPMVVKLTLNLTTLEMRLVYFSSSATVQTEPIAAAPLRIEEAYTGKVLGKSARQLWTPQDLVYESQTLHLKDHVFAYTGLPYANELQAIKAEQLRRSAAYIDGQAVPSYAVQKVAPYRPLSKAKLRGLPDSFIFGVPADSKTVETFVVESFNQLVEDPQVGRYWAAALDSYEHKTIPSLDNNLADQLINAARNSLLTNLVDNTGYQPIQ